jgi:hypothetical protein
MRDAGCGHSEDDRDAREWLALARRGDFTRAWTISDRILQRHIAHPDAARPRHMQSIWMGEPLAGRRVLIRCYHGLGDTIQFIRYAPVVRAIAREVIVWAQPALLPLLRSVRGIDRLIPLHDGSPDPDYDVDVEVMELPYVFRSTFDTLPREIPYVSVTPATLPGTRPRIGLVWRAGDWENQRSMPFDVLRPLLDLEAFTWCSLQHERRPDESHPRLADISVGDVDEAARRIAALDLIISIDSMPAHLAGALGVPVWTLLIKDADWRWMEGCDDNPWYPTMRLFRQGRAGDWRGVIESVRESVNARWPEGSARSG